jgi:hypothetical protein
LIEGPASAGDNIWIDGIVRNCSMTEANKAATTNPEPFGACFSPI